LRDDDAFCRIARGEERAYVAYSDDEVMVILDRSPICRGHLLVISRDHYEGVDSAPPEVVSRAFLVAAAEAGQVVFHFHVHVIPRWRDCPPPIFSDEGVDVSRVARRHRLTEEEAREVLSGLRGLPEFIRGYLGVSKG
jgi:histidine triad (HIT) family protein